jgi:hypothetical protein
MKDRKNSSLLRRLEKFQRLFFVALLSVLAVGAFAQSKTVSGTVLDKTGESVIGASVVVPSVKNRYSSAHHKYHECLSVILLRRETRSVLRLSPEEIISSIIRTSLPSTLLPRNSWATIGLRPFTTWEKSLLL